MELEPGFRAGVLSRFELMMEWEAGTVKSIKAQMNGLQKKCYAWFGFLFLSFGFVRAGMSELCANFLSNIS